MATSYIFWIMTAFCRLLSAMVFESSASWAEGKAVIKLYAWAAISLRDAAMNLRMSPTVCVVLKRAT